MSAETRFDVAGVLAIVQARMAAIVGEMAEQTIAHADPHTPVATGYLLSRNQVQQVPGQPEALAMNDAPYAFWVERHVPFLEMGADEAALELPAIVRRHLL